MIKVIIPSVGESISEVTLSKWKKQSGDLVTQDEIIAEVESEKASFEISAEKSGKLIVKATEGATLAIGDAIADIDDSVPVPKTQEQATSVKKVDAKKAAQEVSPTPPIKTSATPLAKLVSNEMGVDLDNVAKASPHKKITKSDVIGFAMNTIKDTSARTSRREKMTNLRKTISRRLVEAKNATAMLTTFNEVDMSAVMGARTKYKDAFKEKFGVNLGFMSFFTRACCVALKEIPAINAYLDGDEIIYNGYCDISIAVSTPKGLVVPVIRSADQMHLHEIEQSVVDLAKKARDGKLTMDDMQGGTFTITNGGVFGSLLSTPIINPPQSAILGMHKIEDRPVVINKKVEVRPMMYLALSYDHRIIDGKESVSFLVRVKEMLENPVQLIAGKDPLAILLGM